MLRFGPYCSNKADSSSSSTFESIFRTNKVREGCSPSGCSMVAPGAEWPSNPKGVGEAEPLMSTPEPEEPIAKLENWLERYCPWASKGSIPNISSSMEGEAVVLRWFAEGALGTLLG